ncbi:hypothetical protein [Streptomyces bottropensis]|uniref:hypothetical protein n=1 Tax=Streptomyces bottropensis TaxID=42235 RepID=UPI00368BDB94
MYGLIAVQERVPAEYAVQVGRLAAWGFVTFHPDRPDVPVALDPQVAARRRAQAELAEAEARMARLKALPDMSDQLGEVFERAQWRTGGGCEFIDDPVTVNARLEDVVGSAREQILSAQPNGPRDRELLERSLERDAGALRRGVQMRTLYRDTVRQHPVTAEYARVMTGHGADYRTLVGHFERCIVVDGRTAFISDHVVEGAPEHAAWLVTDRAMVAFISAVFEGQWRRADPWHGDIRPRTAPATSAASGTAATAAVGALLAGSVDTVSAAAVAVRTTPRQREILRDIAAGIEQRITARRIGISTRKLTDEITELKALFGASSLPQLTFQWALSPDRLMDDSAPTDTVTAGAGIAGALGVETAA